MTGYLNLFDHQRRSIQRVRESLWAVFFGVVDGRAVILTVNSIPPSTGRYTLQIAGGSSPGP